VNDGRERDLGYKGLIKDFMRQIGRGKCAIAVISDKYLKSENCMFELVEIAKNGDFYDWIAFFRLSLIRLQAIEQKLAE
jgi:hypothetical protein